MVHTWVSSTFRSTEYLGQLTHQFINTDNLIRLFPVARAIQHFKGTRFQVAMSCNLVDPLLVPWLLHPCLLFKLRTLQVLLQHSPISLSIPLSLCRVAVLTKQQGEDWGERSSETAIQCGNRSFLFILSRQVIYLASERLYKIVLLSLEGRRKKKESGSLRVCGFSFLTHPSMCKRCCWLKLGLSLQAL